MYGNFGQIRVPILKFNRPSSQVSRIESGGLVGISDLLNSLLQLEDSSADPILGLACSDLFIRPLVCPDLLSGGLTLSYLLIAELLSHLPIAVFTLA